MATASEVLQQLGAWAYDGSDSPKPDSFFPPTAPPFDRSIALQTFLRQNPREDNWSVEAYHARVGQAVRNGV